MPVVGPGDLEGVRRGFGQGARRSASPRHGEAARGYRRRRRTSRPGRGRAVEATRGREGDGFDRSIDVLVSRLRRKLGGKDTQLIKTVRNGGYQLAVKVEAEDGPA